MVEIYGRMRRAVRVEGIRIDRRTPCVAAFYQGGFSVSGNSAKALIELGLSPIQRISIGKRPFQMLSQFLPLTSAEDLELVAGIDGEEGGDMAGAPAGALTLLPRRRRFCAGDEWASGKGLVLSEIPEKHTSGEEWVG